MTAKTAKRNALRNEFLAEVKRIERAHGAAGLRAVQKMVNLAHAGNSAGAWQVAADFTGRPVAELQATTARPRRRAQRGK
ncbi:MAG: hypothetical protein M5U05_19650 [Anaerolineales bacterium]|nr:hypothetical protein [Anaerolineales bacterium]